MNNRMLVAIMIEYRKAFLDLNTIILKLSATDFKLVRDDKTKDSDCKSILTITRHCIQSGYTYANYIDSVTDSAIWLEYENEISDPKKAVFEIDKMLDHTETILAKLGHLTDEEIQQFSLKTRWHVTYDVEQLLEHAIVHILRHRLQIENFLKA